MINEITKKLSITSALCAFFISGCTISSSSDMKAAVDKFDSAIKVAADALEVERKSRPRTRRFEAIEYYVQTRNFNFTETASIPDFTSSDKIGSFARFTCAGSGSLIRENNAIQYDKQYSLGLKDIFESGSDSLPSQYKRFKKLNKVADVITAPEQPQKNAVQSCATEVINLLGNWKPVPTTDTYDENPAAIVPVAIEAIKALNELAITLAKKYNDGQAKEKFSEYVKINHVNFSKVMEEDLSADRLSNSWDHRKAVSLQQPLLTFKKIFDVGKLDKNLSNFEDNDNKIREIGLIADKQLEEFDSIKNLPSPVYIRQKIIDSEDKLMKIANNEDISIGEVVSFLSSTIDDFNEIKKQYDTANESISKLAKEL
jgi:hypothetical protein